MKENIITAVALVESSVDTENGTSPKNDKLHIKRASM